MVWQGPRATVVLASEHHIAYVTTQGIQIPSTVVAHLIINNSDV
jgi:hypothetical protein